MDLDTDLRPDWSARGYVPLGDVRLDGEGDGPDPDAADGVCPRCGTPLELDGCTSAGVRLRR